MFIRLFYAALLCMLLSSPLKAQEQLHLSEKPSLRVGFNISEPLVFKKDGQYKGHMIDLWEQIADELHLKYDYIELDGFDEVFQALKGKQIDIGINGLYYKAEREDFIDYTVPTFNTGQQIMVRSSFSLINQMIDIIFSQTLLYALLVFCGFIFFAAHMIWWIERKRNPAFSQRYFEGIMESIWWTTVTLTTVGYGDKIPMRIAGKFFAIFWMLMGYFILAYFTASITSILTVTPVSTEIQSLEDLKGKKVGTVDGAGFRSLQKYALDLKLFKKTEELYPALESGALEAIILDSPILKYYALNKGKGQLAVVGDIFEEEFWGLALQQGSPHKEVLNQEIMRLHENGFIKRLNDKWFEGSRTY